MTTLADIITPEIYTPLLMQESMRASALIDSGCVAVDPRWQQTVNQEPNNLQHNLPFGNALTNGSNVSSDVAGNSATPKVWTEGTHEATLCARNEHWSAMDLTYQVGFGDPIAQIAAQTGAYWGREWDIIALATLAGIIADNEANDGGDMVHDSGATIDRTSVMAAQGTSGDALRSYTHIVMHSTPYNIIRDADHGIEYRPDSMRPDSFIEFYLGMRIVVSDEVPRAGVGPYTYDTYMMAAGAIKTAVGTPKRTVGTSFEELVGDGGGQELLHNWQTRGFHVPGVGFVKGGIAGKTPTDAELAAAAQWNRVWGRKNIPICVLRSTEAT